MTNRKARMSGAVKRKRIDPNVRHLIVGSPV
jgi:hypothetical protein